MRHARHRRRVLGILAATMLALAWLYVAPALSFGGIWDRLTSPALGGPLLRSLLVGVASATLAVAIGFLCAIRLRHISPASPLGGLLVLLLLPVLVGDLVVGFALKSIATSGTWFAALFGDRPPYLVMVAIILVQVWQYGLLCAYLCWLRLSSLDRPTRDFVLLQGLSHSEAVRDVLWPRCRPLCVVLMLFCFFSAVHETGKSWLLFKVSPGTRTTLIGHALWDQYHQRLPVSPHFAIDTSLRECGAVTIVVLLTTIPVLLVGLTLISTLIALTAKLGRSPDRRAMLTPTRGARTLTVLVSLLSLLPLCAPLCVFSLSPSIDWGAVVLAAIVATLGAFVASASAIAFAFCLRAASPRHLARFGAVALLVLVCAMTLRGLPSLTYVLAGYGWFAFAADSPLTIWIGWAVGQALLALPLLGAFGIWVHTQVTREELEFQYLNELSTSQLVRRSFVDRFSVEYVFTLVFALSLVWNEGTINRVVSDHVPTFVDLLSRHLSARPEFAKSASIAMMSLGAGLCVILLWRIVQKRSACSGSTP